MNHEFRRGKAAVFCYKFHSVEPLKKRRAATPRFMIHEFRRGKAAAFLL
jgi:hypothetical protein